ncbi:MAG: S8 family serine peptidase [Chloroflexi bacterium]|nr:S8 family serine peptidase [Chloroflexota bacterium]
MTGVNWNAKILPVRVLGKCGGYTSDIVDGMKWAAGLSVTGVPNNAYPADVLNLSLGGYGACATSEQNAINAWWRPGPRW